MKNLPFVLGVSFLLALLTWLLLRGIDTNAPAYGVTLRAFDDYALAEASLHRDVLQARAGLLRNYDAFTSHAQAMENAVARLRSHAQAESLDIKPVDRLGAGVIEQEGLLERFKTSNALLQNSLSYVGLLSTNPEFLAHEVRLAPATGALAAAILHLSRDTSSDALKALQDRIDQFAQQAPTTGPEAETARAMLAHARLLYEQLPIVDETLRTFIAVPSAQALDETRTLFARHRAAVEAVERLPVAAHHAGVSRPQAARPRSRTATSGGLRTRHSREFDTTDQLHPSRNRHTAEAGAGRTQPDHRC